MAIAQNRRAFTKKDELRLQLVLFEHPRVPHVRFKHVDACTDCLDDLHITVHDLVA